MSDYYARYLLLACCAVACRLMADPIPTLTATSASASASSCYRGYCGSSASASGPSFTVGVSDPVGGAGGFYLNSDNSPFFSFSSPQFFSIGGFRGSATGDLTLGGITYLVEYWGGGEVVAPFITISGNSISITVSSGDITAPPITPSSPSTTIVLPATMTGFFFPVCVLPSPFASCTPSPSAPQADISIDLPGLLTVHLGGLLPYYDDEYLLNDVTESFTTIPEPSTTIPEPSAIFLFLLGILAMITFPLRRFRRI